MRKTVEETLNAPLDEEAIVEMCLAGVSTRRIEDVLEFLWGRRRCPPAPSSTSTRGPSLPSRPGGCYPHVFVGGIFPKHGREGSCESVAVLVAAGVNSAGDREVIGCSEGHAKSAGSWREFFSRLKGRWLSGVRLVAGDKRGDARRARGGASRGPPAAPRGAFLPQRFLRCA